jgi:branched-chain amino acid transport system substrate-binding protein
MRLHRRSTRLVLGLVLGAAATASAALTAGATVKPSTSTTLTAGVLHAFTGQTAFFGSNAAVSCAAAAGQIDAVGGILGHRLACKNFDTKGDPADAVPVTAQMLATTKNLVMIVGPDGNDIPSVLPLLNQAKIPEMNTVGDPRYDTQTSKYFWRLTPSDSSEGPALAYAAVKKGWKKVAELFTNDTSGQTVVGPFRSALKKLGGSEVLQLSVTPDQASYQTEVARVIAAHPQAIVGDVDARTAATFLSELQQQNGSLIPIVAGQQSVQGDWVSAVQPAIGASALSSSVTAVAQNLTLTGPAYAAFKASVTKAGANSFQTANAFVAATFDGVVAFALAMNLAHSVDPQVYVKYIPQVSAAKKGAKVVYTYAQALTAIKHHKAFRYVGASGPLLFNKYGTANRAYVTQQYDSSSNAWITRSTIPASALTP